MVPLWLFPTFLAVFARHCPSQATYYIPMLFTSEAHWNRGNPAIEFQLIWLAGLVLISRLAWNWALIIWSYREDERMDALRLYLRLIHISMRPAYNIWSIS